MNRLTFIIGIALLTTYGKAETIANMSNIRIVASVNIDTTYKNNILQSQWGSNFTWRQHFTLRPKL